VDGFAYTNRPVGAEARGHGTTATSMGSFRVAAKIVSVANMKGGVGKTTIAVALAHAFANAADGGRRVLLVDLDAQANASFWLCGDEALTEIIQAGKTIDAFLEDTIVLSQPRSLRDFVHPAARTDGAGSLSVIPCSPELRMIEREMIYFLSETRRGLKEVETLVGDVLRAQLAEIKHEYDFIVFDSAPGISALTEAALRASDVVVVPTVPDFISNLGLEAFCRSVWWPDAAENDRAPWVVANMVRETAHHRTMLREMRAEATSGDGGFRMFSAEIPSLAVIEEAAMRARSDVREMAVLFAPEAAFPFRALAAEVAEAARAAS
jgi:chromosome partitioning protein